MQRISAEMIGGLASGAEQQKSAEQTSSLTIHVLATYMGLSRGDCKTPHSVCTGCAGLPLIRYTWHRILYDYSRTFPRYFHYPFSHLSPAFSAWHKRSLAPLTNRLPRRSPLLRASRTLSTCPLPAFPLSSAPISGAWPWRLGALQMSALRRARAALARSSA